MNIKDFFNWFALNTFFWALLIAGFIYNITWAVNVWFIACVMFGFLTWLVVIGLRLEDEPRTILKSQTKKPVTWHKFDMIYDIISVLIIGGFSIAAGILYLFLIAIPSLLVHGYAIEKLTEENNV